MDCACDLGKPWEMGNLESERVRKHDERGVDFFFIKQSRVLRGGGGVIRLL